MQASSPQSGFWDKVAEKYSRQPIADENAYRTKLRVTQSYLRPDMNLLEIGCGTGGTARIHAPFVRHIRAIDYSQKMIDIARMRAESEGVRNVDFERTDIESLDSPDASVDAVLAMSLLHLLEDKDAAIAKIYRMLRPGGIFVSSTACLGDTMAFIKYVTPLARAFGLMPYLDVMTTGQLQQSLATAGFAIDHQWQPGRGKAVFIVARKAG